MREKRQARIAEWLLVRQTATLGDVVDEATFVAMCDVKLRTFRDWHWRGTAHGELFPPPIYRPDGLKPIWLKAEAEKFARHVRAARKAKQ